MQATTTSATSGPFTLLYIGDPMCSWCYGFGKELSALRVRYPAMPLEIMVGGLRAGATDLLDDAGKQFRLPHWARVEAASGLPFNRAAFLARSGFVYDTEPVCRAVVTARRLAGGADLLGVFRALQHGFYADGLDTTDGAVLSTLAVDELARQQHAVAFDVFHAEWHSPAAIAEAAADFAQVRALGVNSFPALLLKADGRLLEVSAGYAGVDELDRRLLQALARHAGKPRHAAAIPG